MSKLTFAFPSPRDNTVVIVLVHLLLSVYFFRCFPNSSVYWAASALSHAMSTILQRAHSSQHHSLNPSFLPRYKLPRRGKKTNQTKPSCATHPRLFPSVSVNSISQTLGLYFPSVLWVKHEIIELNGMESIFFATLPEELDSSQRFPFCFQTFYCKCLKNLISSLKKPKPNPSKNIFVYILICQK